LQNDLATLQIGLVTLLIGFAPLRTRFVTLQNDLATLQIGFVTLRIGFASLENRLADKRHGFAGKQTAPATGRENGPWRQSFPAGRRLDFSAPAGRFTSELYQPFAWIE